MEPHPIDYLCHASVNQELPSVAPHKAGKMVLEFVLHFFEPCSTYWMPCESMLDRTVAVDDVLMLHGRAAWTFAKSAGQG